LGSKTPLQTMKDWHTLKPALFKRQPYYRPGCDNYPDRERQREDGTRQDQLEQPGQHGDCGNIHTPRIVINNSAPSRNRIFVSV